MVSNIPQFDFDFKGILAPLVMQYAEIYSSLMKNLSITISSYTQSFSEIIDLSMLTYPREWSERHDALVKFGWHYLSEIPEEVINDIYERRNIISSNEVDVLITSYFRKESCAILKTIVKQWDNSPCFEPRHHVFEEAVVCHSRRIFNASVTLLALHTEGVITDFARIGLQSSKPNAKDAIDIVKKEIENIPISIFDWHIYSDVLENILKMLDEHFERANPSLASNDSRHKIAHGYAVEPESEANSLKRFLYLNEIYRLFSLLDTCANKT